MDRQPVIRVIVVDDHQVVREGLISMLQATAEIVVVGQAADAPDAIDKALELKPDVVLLDLRLPGSNGLDVCRNLQLQVPESRTIMLTSYQEEDYLFEALRAGAWGYLSKTASHSEITGAITAVARGRRLLSAPLVDKLVERYAELASEVERQGSGFEQAEIDIIRLLSRGASRREIAQRTRLSESSVKRRLQRIFDKLGAEDRTSAAVEAMRRGLI